MLQSLFGFNPAKHNIKTEIIAGVTTFLTMAYILAVNPEILSQTGMDKGALFTATALAAIISTLIMAIYAKLPFALAPGMGLNTFFAFTVCLVMGYSWQFALAGVFIEGIIFILLTITNLREKIIDTLPLNLKYAISAGIGLFIAFVGLQNAQIVVRNDATLLSLGNLLEGNALIAVTGLIVTTVLLINKVRGALLIGIVVSTLLGIPLGITKMDGVVSMPPSLDPLLFQFDFNSIFTKDMVVVVFTFLFVDMFDTIGTLVGVSTKAGMIDKRGRIPHLKQAFMADAVGTTIGAAMGTSTVTTYVESASGVAAGGRTGLTAFVVAICFTLALIFAPLFLSIPAAATASALILVGMMMASQIRHVRFYDYTESVSSFICLLVIPLGYSISDGIVLGMLSYVTVNILSCRFHKITLSMIVLSIIFTLKFI